MDPIVVVGAVVPVHGRDVPVGARLATRARRLAALEATRQANVHVADAGVAATEGRPLGLRVGPRHVHATGGPAGDVEAVVVAPGARETARPKTRDAVPVTGAFLRLVDAVPVHGRRVPETPADRRGPLGDRAFPAEEATAPGVVPPAVVPHAALGHVATPQGRGGPFDEPGDIREMVPLGQDGTLEALYDGAGLGVVAPEDLRLVPYRADVAVARKTGTRPFDAAKAAH